MGLSSSLFISFWLAILATLSPMAVFGTTYIHQRSNQLPLHTVSGITFPKIIQQQKSMKNVLENKQGRMVVTIRGGGRSSSHDGDIEISTGNDDSDVSFFLVKSRNVIRSLLQFSDKRAPIVSSVLRKIVKSVEGMTGMKLLPPKKNKKYKNKKSSSSKAKTNTTDDVDDNEKGEDSKTKKTSTSSSSSSSSSYKGKKKVSAAAKSHMEKKLKASNPNYRIQTELKDFIKNPPPNLSVQVGSNMRVWLVTMVGANKTIYEGEVFKLRISFPKDYPIVPPSVYFLQGHVPVHEHVYTNGDICLSLLGKGWKPTMTARSIAVSILSMLSSAQSKSLPMDNARHAGNKPGEYQKDWVYHDDNC